MRTTIARLLLAAGIVAASGAARAQTAPGEDANVHIRLDAAYLAPSGGSAFEQTFGPDASFEYRFGPLVGAEAGLVWGRHGIEGATGLAVDATTLLLSANLHVVRKDWIDVYLGPSVGYGFWGDIVDSVTGGRTRVKSDFVFGASAALDLPFGKSWAANLGLRYLRTRVVLADGSGRAEEVNPVEARAGVAYRF